MISCEFENGNKAKLRHVCVDSLVIKGGKILMVKRSPSMREGGKWGIVGGFMDLNETLTQTAEREVMEETGYKIQNPTLLTIIDKPDRRNDDRQNLSFIYFCEATKKVGEPDNESTEQKWFDLNNLPSDDQLAFDSAYYIALYKKYLQEHFDLPLLANV
jgi:ADP-ribose pyrophosphatase YjhB (NUDIX family)